MSDSQKSSLFLLILLNDEQLVQNLFDKLAVQPKAFHDYIMTALGVANFCDEAKLRPLRPRDIEWGTETTQELRGFALVCNSKKKCAFYRRWYTRCLHPYGETG